MNFKLPWWRFWLPLMLQVALILVVPVRSFYTLLTGKTAILQTVPVDPYDLMRGYSQTLRYDISQPETLRSLPGWESLIESNKGENRLNSQIKGDFYAILAAPTPLTPPGRPPQPWKPVAVSRDRPSELPANRVAIQGKMSNYAWIDYGLEAYYFPEEQRQEIEDYLNQTRNSSQESSPLFVEVKVDSRGQAVPVSLWVGDRQYRF